MSCSNSSHQETSQGSVCLVKLSVIVAAVVLIRETDLLQMTSLTFTVICTIVVVIIYGMISLTIRESSCVP